MPLIEIVASPATLGPREPSEILRAVNGAVASALGAVPDVAWSTWRDVDEGNYVIGGEDAPEHEGPLPPLVHIFARRTPKELELIVDAIERVLRELLVLDDAAVLITTQPFRG